MAQHDRAAGQVAADGAAIVAGESRGALLRLEDFLDFFEVGRVGIVERLAQISERRARHLTRVVEHAELALELRGLLGVEHNPPAIRRRLELGDVVGQPGGARVIRRRVDVALVVVEVEQVGIHVLEVR